MYLTLGTDDGSELETILTLYIMLIIYLSLNASLFSSKCVNFLVLIHFHNNVMIYISSPLHFLIPPASLLLSVSMVKFVITCQGITTKVMK